MRCRVILAREGSSIVARCDEYPQCEGRGVSREEALTRLRASLRFWLETCPCDVTLDCGLELVPAAPASTSFCYPRAMRFVPLALATLCLLVFFIGLDRIAATDWREARDAEVAREIVTRREILAPIYAYEPLFEKPILGYAPEVVARLLDPRSPLRSRQIRGGLAVALILLTASIGARHFGMRAAWLSALVLGSSLALPFAARADGTQLLATLLGWVTCAGLADVVFGRSAGRDLRLVVTYGALGAVLVCAGPLPALWPLGGLLLYTALARTPGAWARARPVAGLLLAAGVALPWYGAMTERYGTDFLAHAPFFPYAVETRVAWFSGVLFAPSFLVTGFFPWCALLPGAMLHAATGWRERRLPEIFGRTVGIAGAARNRRPTSSSPRCSRGWRRSRSIPGRRSPRCCPRCRPPHSWSGASSITCSRRPSGWRAR